MNDQQKQCFDMVYNITHDERHECGNLITFINICFQDSDSEYVGIFLKTAVLPYLSARMEMGEKVMELLYSLKSQSLNDS